MASENYSYIDISALDAVRERFAAGDALAILSASLEDVIWANGPGAALFGGDIASVMGGASGLAFPARRQIMATSGYPAIGRDRPVLVRLASGMTSRVVQFLASAVALPDGEAAILLAVPASSVAKQGADEIAARAIDGLSGHGQFTAMVDAGGTVLAASDGFEGLGISTQTLATLAGDTARSDRLVKRMIAAGSRTLPAGFVRLADDPVTHLLVVVDEGEPAAHADADIAGHDTDDRWYFHGDADAGVEAMTGDVPANAEVTAVKKADGEVSTELTAPPAADLSYETPPVGVVTRAGAPEGSDVSDAESDLSDDIGEDDAQSNLTGAAKEVLPPREAVEEQPVAEGGETSPGEEPVSPIPVDRASGPVRFIWRTDATGRFSAISPEFASAVGPLAANVIGLAFRDVARLFGIDPDGQIANLLDRRDTWSGRSVMWPVAGTDLRIPVDLAALPAYARDRSFEGFRGFGVARGGDAVVDAEATGMRLVARAAPAEPDPTQERQQRVDPFRGEVPALTIEEGPDRRFTDKVIRLAERPEPANDRGLTPGEHSVFREIGDRLRTDAAGSPDETTDAEISAFEEAAIEASAMPADTGPDMPKSPTREATPQDVAAEVMARLAAAERNEVSDRTRDETEATAEDAGSVEAATVALIADANFTPEDANGGAAETVGEIVEHAPLAADDSDRLVDEIDIADLEESDATELAELAELDGAERQIEADAPTAGDSGPDAPAASEQDDPTYAAFAASSGAAVSERSEPFADQGEQEPVSELPATETEIVADASAPLGSSLAEPDLAEPSPVEAVTSETPVIEPAVPEAMDSVPPVAEAPPAAISRETPAAEVAAAALPYRGEFTPSAFATGTRGMTVDTTILEQLPVPVLIHHGDVLHYANREFLDLTGYESLAELESAGGLDELFGEPYHDGVDGDGDRKLRLRTSGGMEFPVEAFLQSVRWNSGKALLLSLRRVGRPTIPARTAPSITPAVAAQIAQNAELEERVAEMRAIIDTATDGVVLIAPDGTIRSISRAAEALFGFDAERVAGKHFATLFAIESQRAARDYLSGLSENGVASVLNDGREVIGREAQGRFIPLFMTIGRLPNDSGYCAVMRDITQWKRAEEELTQARAQAERASSQKTDFLARVSHEIRTPLNAIIGFSELMMDEKFGPVGNDRYRDYLRDINRSGNHVLDLVNDLLDISKIEAGQQEMEYEAVSLNDTLAETVAMMQPQANRERVIIRSSFASRLPEVVADLRSVRQIALNLISNAVRYTQAGGQVIVSTAYETAGDVVMRIRDTGIGMSQSEIEQALKPFKQVSALRRGRGEGTGLGLPLTKAMVEANRARFSITSSPGDGTLVEVTFPSTRVLAD